MSSLSRKALNAGYRFGLTNQIRHIWGAQRLTVLAYHRITDYTKTTFDTFIPNVSATPQEFAAQMDFVAQHFNVVSVDDIDNWFLQNGRYPKTHS